MSQTQNEESKTPQVEVTPVEEFFTRDAANNGIKVPMYTSSGKKTEHWMRIRGVDSDDFRFAENKAKREAVKIAEIQDERERFEAMRDMTSRLVAHVVMDWSLPEPCTVDTVAAFFKKAPQIEEAVNKAASRRALFFAPESSS